MARCRATTNSLHSLPVADNVLARQSVMTHHLHEVFMSDITYVATDEEWLYLASLADLYTRKIVELRD